MFFRLVIVYGIGRQTSSRECPTEESNRGEWNDYTCRRGKGQQLRGIPIASTIEYNEYKLQFLKKIILPRTYTSYQQRYPVQPRMISKLFFHLPKYLHSILLTPVCLCLYLEHSRVSILNANKNEKKRPTKSSKTKHSQQCHYF